MQNSLQLSYTEMQMMDEVFQVFSKYKNRTREFGVQLVHDHFPLKDEEILYEVHDTKKRILSIRPVKKERFVKAPLATAWHQNKDGALEVSMLCCDDSGGDDGGGDSWPR